MSVGPNGRQKNPDNMAGKGDKPRPTNLRKFGNHYDQIEWHRVAEGFRQFDPDLKKLVKLLDKKRNKG